MVAGMLMPLERLRSILELLFREGVLVGERDGCPRRTHPQLPGVANVEVRRAMASLRSRGLVRQTAAWRHLYWYLTDAGVAHLRQYLRLPPDVVPRSLQRVPRPAAPRPESPRGLGWVGQTAAAGAGSAAGEGAAGVSPTPPPRRHAIPTHDRRQLDPAGVRGVRCPTPPGGAAVVSLRGGGEGAPPDPPGL
ncbi:40S ribosomal protein S10b-like [Passer montanus]|uniref:40S ribosomal protein S10b-like n=1 Tax=Passer montanus TaxID=9160 RepID=UPI00195FD42F|nr:40S ribosomal protein S10b-like [Passer montanus]